MTPEKIRDVQFKKLLAFFKVELVLIGAVVVGGIVGNTVEKRAQQKADRDAFEKDSVAKISRYDHAIDSLKRERDATASTLDYARTLAAHHIAMQDFKSQADKSKAFDGLVRGFEVSYKKMSEPLDNKITVLEFKRQNTLDSLALAGAKIRGKSK